jgi:4-amino-4-deoxy-L-arabinose transferase-like glycosyltransferase
VGLVFQLGRTLAGPRVATLAAVLTALHPGLVYYDARKLHPLSFDTALGVLSVLALLRASRRRRAGAALAAGVVLGAAVLQRGSLVLLVPVALVWLWALGPRDRRTLVTIGACAAGVAMAMGPWVARNYAIHGRPIMLTTSAEHFWLGNAPHSYGSNLLPDGRTVFEAAPAEFRDAVLSRNEWGQHELFWKTALDDAKAHPGRFLGGLARKFLLFWSFGLQSGILYPRLYLVLYGAFYAPMLALAVFGAARLIRTSSVETRAAAMLLVVTCVSVSLVQSVFYVDLRHRWGIEPLLLVLAASGALAARPRPASGEAGG